MKCKREIWSPFDHSFSGKSCLIIMLCWGQTLTHSQYSCHIVSQYTFISMLPYWFPHSGGDKMTSWCFESNVGWWTSRNEGNDSRGREYFFIFICLGKLLCCSGLNIPINIVNISFDWFTDQYGNPALSMHLLVHCLVTVKNEIIISSCRVDTGWGQVCRALELSARPFVLS